VQSWRVKSSLFRRTAVDSKKVCMSQNTCLALTVSHHLKERVFNTVIGAHNNSRLWVLFVKNWRRFVTIGSSLFVAAIIHDITFNWLYQMHYNWYELLSKGRCGHHLPLPKYIHFLIASLFIWVNILILSRDRLVTIKRLSATQQKKTCCEAKKMVNQSKRTLIQVLSSFIIIFYMALGL
jgi:hypothetical protein